MSVRTFVGAAMLLCLGALVRAADCPAPTTKPTKGTACTDTVFGTTITRASDHTADSQGSWVVSEYSRRQAFNADESYYFVMDSNGTYWLHNTTTKAKIKSLSSIATGLVWDAEPIWHSSNPSILYHLGIYGGSLKIRQLNVDTEVETVAADFAARLTSYGAPWSAAAYCSTRDEGSPSADGRYWAFMCATGSWSWIGMFTYDLQTDTIINRMEFGALGTPNNVSMTASGRYVVAVFDAPARVRAYLRDLSDWTVVDCGPSHFDLALGVDGDDYYVGIDWTNYGDSNCSPANGYGFSRNIDDGFVSQGYATARVDLLANYGPGNSLSHVSTKAFGAPGKVLFTNSSDATGTLADAAVIADVTGTPAPFGVMRINNVRIDYFTSAHCTISRDGSLVLCGSNWRRGSAGTTDMDVYIAETGLTSTFTITTTTMANGTNGQAYQADAQTSGGTQPPTACITSAGSVPPGATWSVSGNACRLSDASAETGTYNFTLQATDSNSNTDTQAFTLNILAALTINTTTLPDGTQGAGYNQALSISGGTPPYTCTVQSGSLPAGASLGGTGNCTITASNLTTVGTSNFTIRATDDVAATDDQALSITVSSGSTVSMMTPVIDPLATSVMVTTGGVGLDYNADCQVILKDNGGATVDTATSTSGFARRRLSFTGLTASTTYSMTFTCDGATPDVTPYPFVTDPAPSGGNRTVPIYIGAPSSIISPARVTVEYDDNEALSSPASVQNTSCGSGCTVNLTIPAGLYWWRQIWQTAGDVTIATSAIQPLLVE